MFVMNRNVLHCLYRGVLFTVKPVYCCVLSSTVLFSVHRPVDCCCLKYSECGRYHVSVSLKSSEILAVQTICWHCPSMTVTSSLLSTQMTLASRHHLQMIIKVPCLHPVCVVFFMFV